MAARASSASRRKAASKRRTPAGRASLGSRDLDLEPWPSRRRSSRVPVSRRISRRAAAIPGPLDVAGRILVGFWMGLAHSIGWLVRAVGRGAATARQLHPQHQRDGAGLVTIALALLLAVAVWWGAGGPVGADINEFARLLFGATAI